MEREISLRLTETECNTIANLFDVAVKAAGLQAAAAALPLMEKIRKEIQSAIVPASSVPSNTIKLPSHGQ